MDSIVDGQRYRKLLHGTDWRAAKEREKQRLAKLARRPADPARQSRSVRRARCHQSDRGVRKGATRPARASAPVPMPRSTLIRTERARATSGISSS